jgi:hypothetical protein
MLAALAAVPCLFAGEPDRGAAFLSGAFLFPLRPALVSEDGAGSAGAGSAEAAAAEAPPLTPAEKAETWKWAAAVFNLFPGFGLGSGIQGDRIGAIVCGVGDVLSAGFLLAAALPYVTLVPVFFLAPLMEEEWEKAHSQSEGLLIISGIFFVATRLFGIIRPFVYADQFKADAVPTVDDRGNLGLTCSVRFRF